jgi:hypothetical protein
MARLRCDSRAERWLIPAFVFFFQMLYPFRWANDPRARTAAAAGVPFVFAKYGFGGFHFGPTPPDTPYVAEHARDLPDLIERDCRESRTR